VAGSGVVVSTVGCGVEVGGVVAGGMSGAGVSEGGVGGAVVSRCSWSWAIS
jgi:hypothetical protein